MQSIVWFSGPSAMNLVDVVPYGKYTELGCNFMYQYRSVDHAVCYDHQVIIRMPDDVRCERWCRHQYARSHWHTVIRPYSNQHISDSGTLAVEVSQRLGATHTWIIGCDWGVSDASIQNDSYQFRGYQPAKYSPIKDKWLAQLDHARVTWVHLERQPWMQSYINHSDFLDSAMSDFH